MNPVTPIDKMYDLMCDPIDDKKSALGWKRHLDYFVPKSTEGRNNIYGEETFQKIQKVEAVKVGLSIGSMITSTVLGAMSVKWADMGKWISNHKAALNGKPSDIFGTPPVDPYPRQSQFMSGDEGTGFTSNSPHYKYLSKVDSKYQIHWLGFISALLGVITVVPMIFKGIEMVVNYSTKEQIKDDLDMRVMTLRNEIIDKGITPDQAEQLINNKHDFVALFRFGKSDLLDTIYDSTLRVIRDDKKPEAPIEPVGKEKDIVDLTGIWDKVSGITEIDGERVGSYYSNTFTAERLEKFIESSKSRVEDLKAKASEASGNKQYQEAANCQEQELFLQNVIKTLEEELKNRKERRESMGEINQKISTYRNTNALRKTDDVKMLRKLDEQNKRITALWQLIHSKEVREQLPRKQLSDMDVIVSEIESVQKEIDEAAGVSDALQNLA